MRNWPITLSAAAAQTAQTAAPSQLRLCSCRYDHQQPTGYQQGIDSGAGSYPVKDYAHDGSKEFEHDPAAVGSAQAAPFTCSANDVPFNWLATASASRAGTAGCINRCGTRSWYYAQLAQRTVQLLCQFAADKGLLHLQCAGSGSGRRALLEVEPGLEHQQLVGQARAEPGGTLSGLQLWLTAVAGWRKRYLGQFWGGIQLSCCRADGAVFCLLLSSCRQCMPPLKISVDYDAKRWVWCSLVQGSGNNYDVQLGAPQENFDPYAPNIGAAASPRNGVQ